MITRPNIIQWVEKKVRKTLVKIKLFDAFNVKWWIRRSREKKTHSKTFLHLKRFVFCSKTKIAEYVCVYVCVWKVQQQPPEKAEIVVRKILVFINLFMSPHNRMLLFILNVRRMLSLLLSFLVGIAIVGYVYVLYTLYMLIIRTNLRQNSFRNRKFTMLFLSYTHTHAHILYWLILLHSGNSCFLSYTLRTLSSLFCSRIYSHN